MADPRRRQEVGQRDQQDRKRSDRFRPSFGGAKEIWMIQDSKTTQLPSDESEMPQDMDRKNLNRATLGGPGFMLGFLGSGLLRA